MRKRTTLILFIFFPVFSFFFSLCIGVYPIPPHVIVKIIFEKLLEMVTLGKFNSSSSSLYETIILQIRLPRIITAMIVGSALSVSGAVLQATFRNPLVDSYIVGISAGAAFGAALAFGFLPMSVEIVAFTFSLFAMFLTYSLAKIRGRATVISLILAGIIVNAFYSALTSFLKFLMEHEKLATIVYYLMGSFANANWNNIKIISPIVFLGSFIIFLMRWQLNILSLGEQAKILGCDVEKIRAILIFVVSLMTSASVAFCGVIGWVGLIIPHIIRMGFGADHKILVPLSISVGASFMVLSDTLARSLTNFEIPIGILTTLVGIPFFAYLLKKTQGGWNV